MADPASLLDRDALHGARRLLAELPLRLHFPPALAAGFAARRREEFERFITVSAPVAVLVCLLVMLAGRAGFRQELLGPDGGLWWVGAWFNTAVVTLTALAFLLPAARRHYDRLLPLTAGILMASTVFLSLAITEPRLAQSLTYVVMFVITISTLGLRLSQPVAAVACLAGGLAGMGAALLLEHRPDWGMLFHYYPGALSVSLFIAWLLERQERISFLSSLLLAHESAERERLNRELEQMARSDGLTGLANRRHFDERLAAEWERARRDQRPLALLFIDVDHFKRYNDHYGHAAGDDCLCQVAQALSGALLRSGDLAARYGGEEFVLLLPGTDSAGAEEVALRVLLAVDGRALPHAASPVAAAVTVSVGLAACVPQAGTPAALLKAADEALYRAKGEGRHCIARAVPPPAPAMLPA